MLEEDVSTSSCSFKDTEKHTIQSITLKHPITRSLFENGHDVLYIPLSNESLISTIKNRDYLRWKKSKSMPRLIREILEKVGFQFSLQLVGLLGKTCIVERIWIMAVYESCTILFWLGRKDKLYINVCKLKETWPEINYCPRTYILPRKHSIIEKEFPKYPYWIIKPPASARGSGIGIKIISRLDSIPKQKNVIMLEIHYWSIKRNLTCDCMCWLFYLIPYKSIFMSMDCVDFAPWNLPKNQRNIRI